MLFRKSCLQQTGWFDEAMQATEDRDLWFRIALRYRIAYLDEVVAYYRISPTSMTSNLDRLLKAQLHFVAKHRKSGAASRIDQLQALGNIYRELGDSLFRGGQVGKSHRQLSSGSSLQSPERAKLVHVGARDNGPSRSRLRACLPPEQCRIVK